MLILILVLVGGLLFCAVAAMAFSYPELLSRCGKFLVRAVRHAVGHPAAKPKASKLSPNEVLANQIEQLIPGQILRYKIPETWGGDFITVELNPEYPQKGRKYILSMESIVHGMPGGKRSIIYDSDKSIELATSVLERNGELFVVAEEIPVSAEKVAVDAKKEADGAGRVSPMGATSGTSLKK